MRRSFKSTWANFCFIAASCLSIPATILRFLALVATAFPIGISYVLGTIGALRTPAQKPVALSRTVVRTDTHAEFRQRHVFHQARRRHQIPIALAAPSVPNFPRLRALALFGRRSVGPAESPCCRRPKTSTIGDMVRNATLLQLTYSMPASRSASTFWTATGR